MPSPTTFSGTDDECPIQWLQSLSTAFPPDPAPRQWLERVNSRLCGEAALWAKQHLVTSRILSDENLKNATAEDVQMFKQAFRTRFVPEDDMDDIDLQILTLQQTALKVSTRTTSAPRHYLPSSSLKAMPWTAAGLSQKIWNNLA